MSERVKFLNYSDTWVNSFFWRTYDQQEIDYIEEADGELFAWEFKWNKNSKKKIPKLFLNEYNVKEAKIITPDNFDKFVGLV